MYDLFPHTCNKDDLRRYMAFRGSVLADACELHEAETLVFLGFVGNHNGDGTWTGHLRFRRVQPKDADNDSVYLKELLEK